MFRTRTAHAACKNWMNDPSTTVIPVVLQAIKAPPPSNCVSLVYLIIKSSTTNECRMSSFGFHSPKRGGYRNGSMGRITTNPDTTSKLGAESEPFRMQREQSLSPKTDVTIAPNSPASTTRHECNQRDLRLHPYTITNRDPSIVEGLRPLRTRHRTRSYFSIRGSTDGAHDV